MPESIEDRIAEIYAAESRRVLATLIRLLGDFDQAEEALQEAFGAALTVPVAIRRYPSTRGAPIGT